MDWDADYTHFGNEAICPHCGKKDTDEDVIEGAVYKECGWCGKIYYCDTSILIDYSTRKISMDEFIKDIEREFNNTYVNYRINYKKDEDTNTDIFNHLMRTNILDDCIPINLFNFEIDDFNILKRELQLKPSAISKIEKVYKEEILE